jgi:hypothetical protein
MTVYEKSSCGQCGFTLQNWDVASRGIGVPFLECPVCGSVNDRSTMGNEWDLMPGSQKTKLLALTFYWGFAVGGVLSAGLGLLAMEIWPSLKRLSVASPEALVIIIVGLSIGIGGNFFLLRREIMKSRHRLSDPDYAYVLEKNYPGSLQVIRSVLPNVGPRQEVVPTAANSADQPALKVSSLRQSDKETVIPPQPSSYEPMEEFENAKTAIKFRRDARSAWGRISALPSGQQYQFLRELDKSPDADVAALADKVVAKYRRPFEEDEINDAYETIWDYGEKARDEFRKAVEVLGNNLDLDFVVSQLEFDPGYGNEITDFQSAKEFLTNCGYEIAEVRDRHGSHLVAKKGSIVRHFHSDASLIEGANRVYKAKYDLGKK